MSFMKPLAVGIAALCLSSTPAMAAALVIDSGWQDDQIDGVGIASNSSPWTFTVGAAGAIFRVTDAFATGDVFSITDSTLGLLGSTTFTTTSETVDDYFGVAWSNVSFSRFSTLLGAGSYSITIAGDCAAGCPAGFAVQLASAPAVPEPATWAMFILGFGLVGFSMRRRKGTTASLSFA